MMARPTAVRISFKTSGISKVRLIRCPENRGAAAARNRRRRGSIGHYFAFLDSDDTWEPEKLALQVSGT